MKSLTMKHGDILFGTIGTTATFGLTLVSLTLGCIAGTMTVVVMALKVRKEWKNRNEK